MTTFKKGDVVWAFYDWNRAGTCAYKKLVLTSYGKKQGTAIEQVNGENLETRIYVGQVDLVHVADVQDVQAAALERGVAYRARWIAAAEQSIARYPGDSKYAAYIAKELAALVASEPKAIAYPVRAKVAA